MNKEKSKYKSFKFSAIQLCLHKIIIPSGINPLGTIKAYTISVVINKHLGGVMNRT
jgi:hypothetical protein